MNAMMAKMKKGIIPVHTESINGMKTVITQASAPMTKLRMRLIMINLEERQKTGESCVQEKQQRLFAILQ